MAKSVAIIGASPHRNKFGNKAVRAYRDKGWRVYPVNLTEDEIEGLPTYGDIRDIPDHVDRVALYLPPNKVDEVIDAIAESKPHEIFFNPGTESSEAMKKARDAGVEVIADCAIVAIGASPSRYSDR